MTQDEFYSNLMQDVEYIFKTGFKLSPEMFMQTMSYASEQYELLNKRIAELEAKNTMKQSGNDMYALQVNNLLKKIAELEALQAPKSCDGCVYVDYPDRFNDLNTCKACYRSGLTDYYEPQDLK
jgi:hypothetical protein